jgi:hypothetical protein
MMTGCVFSPAGLGRSITGKEVDFPVHACNIEAMQDGAGRSKKNIVCRTVVCAFVGLFFLCNVLPFCALFRCPSLVDENNLEHRK